MAFSVFDSISPYSVSCNSSHRPGAGRPRPFKVRIYIIDEYSEAMFGAAARFAIMVISVKPNATRKLRNPRIQRIALAAPVN
jgi:hypothetical protein